MGCMILRAGNSWPLQVCRHCSQAATTLFRPSRPAQKRPKKFRIVKSLHKTNNHRNHCQGSQYCRKKFNFPSHCVSCIQHHVKNKQHEGTRKSTCHLPVRRSQAPTAVVPCSNESSEAGVRHLPSTSVGAASAVPQCPGLSGLMRSFSAAPPGLSNKLPKDLVSGTASGCFRSPVSAVSDVDVNDSSSSSTPSFSFPPLTCCRSSEFLPPGNGNPLTAAHLESSGCGKTQDEDHEVEPISVDELASSLLAMGSKCPLQTVDGEFTVAAVVDCRAFVAYNYNHVTSAYNASCGDRIAQKRLRDGKATVADFVSGGPIPESESNLSRDRFKQLLHLAAVDKRVIVAYDDNATCMTSLPATHPLRMVTVCLKKTGAAIKFLRGGLQAFYAAHPQLCSKPDVPPSRPLLYSPTTPVVELDVDSAEMSQIQPFLFIGNERDAVSREVLNKSTITHVLNVTSHIPQHFENDVDIGITYKRLAATDSCSQNLKQYFEEAIAFIESARSSGGRVLVHCQAGVSRSPTIVIAYLMARFNWSMMKAFDFVKSRRSIVAPNLHFMGQLLEFESKCVTGQLRHCLSDDVSSLTILALSDSAMSS